MHDKPELVRGWTRADKLKCRSLYLVRGQNPTEIGVKLGKSASAISTLCCREGWAAMRREAELAAAAEADRAALNDIRTRAQDFAASVADQGEELVEAGFDLTRTAAEKGNAKDFAFAASGTGKLVTLTRRAMGMDAGTLNVANLNVFLGQPKGNSMRKVDTESETLDI